MENCIRLTTTRITFHCERLYGGEQWAVASGVSWCQQMKINFAYKSNHKFNHFWRIETIIAHIIGLYALLFIQSFSKWNEMYNFSICIEITHDSSVIWFPYFICESKWYAVMCLHCRYGSRTDVPSGARLVPPLPQRKFITFILVVVSKRVYFIWVPIRHKWFIREILIDLPILCTAHRLRDWRKNNANGIVVIIRQF